MIDFDNRAFEIARELGYDSIRTAGEKDKYHFYHIFRMNDPKYAGNRFIKLYPDGSYSQLESWTEEWNWAISQEVKLNNL